MDGFDALQKKVTTMSCGSLLQHRRPTTLHQQGQYQMDLPELGPRSRVLQIGAFFGKRRLQRTACDVWRLSNLNIRINTAVVDCRASLIDGTNGPFGD